MPDTPPRPRRAPIPSWLLKILTVAGSLLLGLGLAEIGLRVVESLPADEVADYDDTWREGGLGPGGYLKEGFTGRVRDGYGGTVRWVNNAAGFRRDEEVVRERQPGTLRILSLGDSFTAGYRVDQEETFSHLLEEHLEATGRWREVEVLISVVEEPPTGLHYLTTEGLRWRPDLVLLGITLGNDLAQTHATLDPRGELRLEDDRQPPAIRPNPDEDQAALVAELRAWTLPPHCFDPEAVTPPEPARSKPGSKGGPRLLQRLLGALESLGEGEKPQAVTSLWGEYRQPRLFDNNGLGMFLEPPPPRIESAYARLFSTLNAYGKVCAAHGIGFAVVLFPQRFQVQPRDWRATAKAYGLRPDCFDVMAPNKRLVAFCRRTGISCIDPTAAMRRRFLETGRSLYLPRGDMHWNARGHRALADAIRRAVTDHAAGVGTPM